MTRLAVKATSAVYGTSPRDPAMLAERGEPKEPPASGLAEDAVKIECCIRNFARRRGDVDVTVRRFTNLIGPRSDTVLTLRDCDSSCPACPAVVHGVMAH